MNRLTNKWNIEQRALSSTRIPSHMSMNNTRTPHTMKTAQTKHSCMMLNSTHST